MSSEELSKRIRMDIVKMVHEGRSSHIGSALSCVDILAVLYSKVMKVKPQDPDFKYRDRFILSKGHAGVAVYSTLAQLGFFNKRELSYHYQNGSKFSGHVSHKGIPGVEFSTGSLGHGLSVATGIALSAKLDKAHYRSFVLIGDGELMEGANWEAMLFAAHHKLNNLIVVVDRNNLQSMDTTENTVALEPIKEKFLSFNWDVEEVNGHCHNELEKALSNGHTAKPKVVISNTIKGKGVSFMENSVAWHYKYPDKEQLSIALNELKK